MADPFKLRVLKALTDALKEITPDNDYVHDLADFDPGDGVDTSRVYRGREFFGDSDPLPMLCILESADPAEMVAAPPVAAVAAESDWYLHLQGWVPDDSANPLDPAYALLADVRQRLAVERKALLGLGTGKNRITELAFGSGVCRPPDQLSDKAWFFLPLRLRIVENAALPYV